jgi:hypothetical protein
MDRQEELHRIKTIPPEVILEDLSIPFVKRPERGDMRRRAGGKP